MIYENDEIQISLSINKVLCNIATLSHVCSDIICGYLYYSKEGSLQRPDVFYKNVY